MDCSVCCDKYNITNHKKVDCSYCDYSCCRMCVQSYLVSTMQDPHCMNCKNLWNREFLAKYCTKSFCNGVYKKHREKVLLEREKILMPQTQPLVTREIEARRIEKQIEEMNRELNTLYIKRATLLENVNIVRNTNVSLDDLETRRKFVRKCPIDDCRGFLSTKWKCGVCENYICNSCNELKEEGHQCNPEAVKTMELLKKDTKGCPSCGTMITFIEGCRQMWCPSCHTAFDWATLRIDTGRIHNPHYYEFKLQNGLQGRDHADIPCGGIPDIYEICGALGVTHKYLVERMTLSETDRKLVNIHRAIIHIERIELRYYYDITEEDNKDLRISYMLNELSEIDYKKKIQRREKSREKKRDIHNVLRMFIDTSGDLLRQFVLDKNKKEEIYNTLDKLVSYTSKELKMVSKRYNCVVPYFRYDWSFRK